MAMTPEEDERLWKRRFEAFALVRLLGLILTFGGMVVALKNPWGPEYPAIGAVIGVFGIAVLLGGPKLLKRKWDKEA
ncbi:hypothetical protein [Sphingomicrobium sediminis]|uniref:Uncharacterized protein n=1 Tax=Sphingomicrobium sediminis TaxID=2950949 RepID=A0A9X2EN46_9SPHN|nr:hypothetical protein [Sphingomicrobium sediminis]MCM8558469.1 hypothetical protein [Sphingomicrobium sediminis]